MADIWSHSHGRLPWAAVLPLRSIDESLEEMRVAREHGACAVFSRGLECGDRMLSDPYLPGALVNNARLVFLSVVFQLPMALLLAFAITRLRRGGSVYRFLFFLPVIVPTATMALVWSFVFSGEPYGLLNGLFRLLGLGSLIQPWLSADGVVQWVTSFPTAGRGRIEPQALTVQWAALLTPLAREPLLRTATPACSRDCGASEARHAGQTDDRPAACPTRSGRATPASGASSP